jgi:hypothetical protein
MRKRRGVKPSVLEFLPVFRALDRGEGFFGNDFSATRPTGHKSKTKCVISNDPGTGPGTNRTAISFYATHKPVLAFGA